MKARKALYITIVWTILSLLWPSAWAKGVQHYRLSNGLTVTLIEDRRAPATFYSLWYKVGSADEVNGHTGLSHMLEHMLFRGTPKHPDGAYAEAVGGVGGNFNAMTTRDFTMYYATVPNAALPMVLTLEADRMRHLIINEKLLHKERQVVNEERQMRITDNPPAVLSERLTAAALVNNPYHHPVIGWPHDVTMYTVPVVKSWYNQWYHPNNAALVIVGDYKVKELKPLIQKTFGVIPRATLPSRNHRPELKPLGEKRLLLRYPASVSSLEMAYLVPGIVQADPPWHAYALEVLASVLDGTTASRLPTQLVRKKQLAASISASYYPLHRYLSLLRITAIPTKSLPKLEKGIRSVVKQLQTQLISKKELKQVKAQVMASHIFQKDGLSMRAYSVGLYEVAGLPWDSDKHWLQHIQSVTPQQVRWVARHYLTNNQLTVGYLEPKKKKRRS